MLRLFRKAKAQSTAEYAILIGLVVATVIGIQTYVKRGLQGRFRDATSDYVTGVASDAVNWSIIDPQTRTTPIALEKQFEDTRLSSQSTQDTLRDDITSDMAKNGTLTRDSTRRTKQQTGDYQKQIYR